MKTHQHTIASGMTQRRLAILSDATHYDINLPHALSATVVPFPT
ncbi:MAG TPA: hypothetical protein VKE27_02320 [Candidatus Dormibacteraeota bacterium]|nr:hypothetical protein [Candidatus Dormibacteraeota bacterium]